MQSPIGGLPWVGAPFHSPRRLGERGRGMRGTVAERMLVLRSEGQTLHVISVPKLVLL